ncbi:PRELI domain containing protein 3B [Ceratocystis lukuohia]|uniref:PRELI domain containing protein 3B n=1 Tax=Ceratocystis lukuohia TaxID=2019550 RepID=A0ABR4MNU3_9PEZI
MVLTHSTTHKYSHPFPAVALAYFLRYSSPKLNPFSKHVMGTDTIDCYVDPTTGRLHTTRIHLKKSRIPAAVFKLLPASVTGGASDNKSSYVLEKSVVDIREGWMETESRNLNYIGVLSIVEKQHYKVPTDFTGPPSISNETNVTTTVIFRSRLGEKLRGMKDSFQTNNENRWASVTGFVGSWGAKGVQRSIESIASTKTLDQLGKSREGMHVVLERLRNTSPMSVLEMVRRERRERQLAAT